MKKKHTLIILFYLFTFFVKAQTNFDIYGVCLLSDVSNFSTAFAKVDPGNGNLTLLNKWSKDLHAFGSHTVDPKNKMYYQVSTDPWDMFILKIDLTTGIIVDTVFTQDSVGTGDTTVNWIGGEIDGLFYNCVDEQIYFLYQTKNKKLDNSSSVGTRLAKVDANTGTVSLVTIFPIFLRGGEQQCSKKQQKIILYNSQKNNELIVYDLQTKKISGILLSKNYSYSHYINLIMNTSDNQLYGYAIDNSAFTSPKFMSKCQMIKVNPLNGQVTDLSDPFDFNTVGTLTFEPANNKLYTIGATTNPGYPELLSFDVYTKKRSFYKTTNIPEATLFVGIHVVGDAQLDTDFTFKNLCQNVPVEFNPTTRMGSLEWDFGDPASGTLNTSNQVNPIHTYTQPGTYTVKMTSSNCWNSVTTTKTITIGPFPKIDLGNDITWCLHKKHDELQLKVDIPGATFLWQDLSTADHYTVNKGGVYWVKVSAACEVADSITVNELPCSCDITVSPTLTHTITSFIFECDLSAYDPLALEIYNDRGQIIIRKGITEVITHVNFEQFAAGIYFYQIRDKIEVVKSGKIVFVRK